MTDKYGTTSACFRKVKLKAHHSINPRVFLSRACFVPFTRSLKPQGTTWGFLVRPVQILFQFMGSEGQLSSAEKTK